MLTVAPGIARSFSAAVPAPMDAISQWLPAQEHPDNLSCIFDSMLFFLTTHSLLLESFELNL